MGEKDARLIKIEAQSEGGTVSPEVWTRDIGTAFPAAIESATVGFTNLAGEEFTVLCKAFAPQRWSPFCGNHGNRKLANAAFRRMCNSWSGDKGDS